MNQQAAAAAANASNLHELCSQEKIPCKTHICCRAGSYDCVQPTEDTHKNIKTTSMLAAAQLHGPTQVLLLCCRTASAMLCCCSDASLLLADTHALPLHCCAAAALLQCSFAANDIP
jgi:hypothetical protein